MDMPPTGERLLTIGEFSRLSRISVRMLRHYDEHGVLHPTHVDPFSGYRHYAPSLLRTARQVVELRDVGLGVGELAACVPLMDDPAALRTVLTQQRSRLLDDAAGVADRLRGVDRILTELEGPTMSIEIIHRTVPTRTVASVRGTIAGYDHEGELWQRLMAGLAAAGGRVSPSAMATAVFHDDEYMEANPDVEVQLDVVAPFPDGDDVRCRTVPEQEVVAGTLLGGFEGIGTVMEAIDGWAGEHGYRFAGPMFNVYRVGPAQEPDPTRWVTEVCAPVERVAALQG